MDKKITTWLLLGGGYSCLPELFQKNRQRGEPQNYFGCGVGFIFALSTKLKVLYTREKISDYQFENCHLYSG